MTLMGDYGTGHTITKSPQPAAQRLFARVGNFDSVYLKPQFSRVFANS